MDCHSTCKESAYAELCHFHIVQVVRPLVMDLAFICGLIWLLLARITCSHMVLRVCVLSSPFFSNLEKGEVCVRCKEVRRDREIIDVAVIVPESCREQTYQGVSQLPEPLDLWKIEGSESHPSPRTTEVIGPWVAWRSGIPGLVSVIRRISTSHLHLGMLGPYQPHFFWKELCGIISSVLLDSAYKTHLSYMFLS